MATTSDQDRRTGARVGSSWSRAVVLAATAALLASLTVVGLAPAAPAAAVAPGPEPIPTDLWDAPSPFDAPEPFNAFGDYLVVEGAAGEPIVGDQSFVWTRENANPGGAGYAPSDAGEYADTLTLISPEPNDPSGVGLLVSIWGPGGTKLTDPGFYPYVVKGPPDADRVGLDVRPYDPVDEGPRCEGTVTGWVALDHIRMGMPTGETPDDLTLDMDQPGELDLRVEQSCDGAPPIHIEYHTDLVDESRFGPDPVPDGLWDVVPEGVGDADYVYVEGAEGDPRTDGTDSLYVGDDIVVGDDLDDGGYYDDVLGVLVVPDGELAWMGFWRNHEGRGLVEPGFYLVDDDQVPDALGAAGQDWQSDLFDGCVTDEGWFAVDRLELVDGEVTNLDLRLEQRCDGGPPIHARIHIDREPPPPMLDPGPPLGELESVTAQPGSVSVRGWALDPDRVEPIDVAVSVDGASTAVAADGDRPDVAGDHPAYGADHGFATTLPTTAGSHQVCATARNVGGGADTLLGCRTVTVPGGSPFGYVDAVRAVPGGVQVGGWAIDPDTAGAIAVHAYVDTTGTALVAERDRPDVAAAFPGYGSAHGFSATLPAAPGSHRVCLYGINSGAGANVELGCRAVTVPGGSPFGYVDSVRALPGAVEVAGWAIDPDTASSIPVHVYVDSNGTALTADGDRPDVGAAFPGYGSAHGFRSTIPASPGTHRVCLYGINSGAGANVELGCRAVTVPGGSPFGYVDAVRAVPGGVQVGGWAIDPDTAGSIAVHAYVDTTGTALVADRDRPDVAAAFPGYGSAHGFSATLIAASGSHRVCLYGINSGAGANAELACRTITVP